MHTNCDNTGPFTAAPTTWSILYRGPLSSCNYACDYCPFAKTTNTRQELADDAARLHRFVSWVAAQHTRRIGILCTPWGEALIRRHYQEAFVTLGQMPHVYRVAAQTNLSCSLDWLDRCNKDTVALWCTYHPTEIARQAFVDKSRQLQTKGIRHSIGVVGLKQHIEEIELLRQEMDPAIYVWVNAYKREKDYYSQDDLRRLRQVDPLFDWNNRYHPSAGLSCRAGASAFTVDGDGMARRCHFIPTPIGNIYEPGFAENLQERPCSNDTCGCHIGYVHLDTLQQYPIYQDGLLERIPANPLWRQDHPSQM